MTIIMANYFGKLLSLTIIMAKLLSFHLILLYCLYDLSLYYLYLSLLILIYIFYMYYICIRLLLFLYLNYIFYIET